MPIAPVDEPQVSEPMRAPDSELDLASAARLVQLPRAMHFQQEANVWLTRLRERSRKAGVLPIRCGRVQLDYLDALRSLMLMTNGRVLADLHLAKSLLELFPGGNVSIDAGASAPAFANTIKYLGPQADRIRIKGAVAPSHWKNWFRRGAYRIKRGISRRRGVNRRFGGSPHAPCVLAIARTQSHVADMLPVASMLRQRHGVATVFAVVDRRPTERLHRAGFSTVGLYAGPWSDPVRAAAEARQLNRRFRRSWLQEGTRQGSEFGSPQAAAVIETTTQLLTDNLADVLHLALSLERLLKKLRPQLVLVGNPYTLEGRVAAFVAAGQNLPSAAMEHGNIFPHSPMWSECPLDLICAWGQPSARALQSTGVPSEKIAITGASRYDEVFRRAAASDRSSTGRTDILVATSGAGDQVSLPQHRSFIRMLYEAADLTPDMRWVVKLHNKDREALYEAENGNHGGHVTFERGRPDREGMQIFKYLERARALVTVSSAAALDAMAVGVPVIAVDVWWPAAGLADVEFLNRGCTRKVHDGKQLAAAARQTWEGQPSPSDACAREYAGEHFANAGHATEAVAETLLALMTSRSAHALAEQRSGRYR